MKILMAASLIYMSLGSPINFPSKEVTKKTKTKMKSCPPNSSPLCRIRPKFS